MKISTLLEQLKAAITAEEYENLTNNTIAHISQYNRRTMLEIIGRTDIPEGEVPFDQVAASPGSRALYDNTKGQYYAILLSYERRR